MSEIISATVEIYEGDGDWYLTIAGEMFGPFDNQDQAIDAIPAALRTLP